MFLLISAFITLVILSLLILKRDRILLLFFFLILSLDIYLFYIFVYFAKRGGISNNLNQFFYLNENIRITMRNMILTLPQLGYLISIGRFLFPSLMLFFAVRIVYANSVRLNRYRWFLFIPTVLSLIFYYPSLFRLLSYEWQSTMMCFSLIWIVLYSILSVGLFLIDVIMIRPSIQQMKYFSVNFFCCFLIMLYLLYCTQDGAQVFNFYSYNLPWTLGLSYLRLMMSEVTYAYILIIYSCLGVIGLIGLYFYLSDIVEMSREEIILRNKSQTTLPATHIFVHGLKNRLLVEQSYIKQMKRKIDVGEDEDLIEVLNALHGQNQGTLTHLDELYYSFRHDVISLQKKPISEVIASSAYLFYEKYPDAPIIQVNQIKEACVMVDDRLLSEALSNILINGYEAMQDRPEFERKLRIEVRSGIFNVIVSLVDQGIGLSAVEKKSVYYPFTTNKNSNDNWGMGLFFAKKVIKQHSGKIYIETLQGKGTTFRIILPKRRGC